MRQVLPLTIAAALLLTVPALAQEGATLPRGAIYLAEPIEVEVGETLRVGPGTRLSGPANVTVWGTLIVEGTEGDPAEFNVPVRVLDGGRADLRQARLWGVNATALEVFGGEVTLVDSLLEGNERAAIVKGQSRLAANGTVFRDHTGEAVYVEESATVHMEAATFSGNGRGVTVYSARAFHVRDSDFVDNRQHVVIDLGPWSAPGIDARLDNNTFRAPAPSRSETASVSFRHSSPAIAAGEGALIRMSSNRIEGAAIGLQAEGIALTVESVDDTFVGNVVGIKVPDATVDLLRPRFGNDRDVDGSGKITMTGVVDLSSGETPFHAPTAASRAWLPWAIGSGALALLAIAAFGGARLLRKPPAPRRALPRREMAAPPPIPEALSAPAAPAAAGREPAARELDLSPLERRILEDIHQHPGSAQRDIAERLGYTRQALHYHVKKLEARKLVVKRAEGRETRCELPPSVAALVAAQMRTGSHEKA